MQAPARLEEKLEVVKDMALIYKVAASKFGCPLLTPSLCLPPPTLLPFII